MSTNQGLLAAFAALGALAAVFVVVFAAVFAALAAYDAVSGSNMADDMGNMMKDMGGMMDDGRGDVMDGMMGGGRVPETTGAASGRGAVAIAGFSFRPTTLNVTPGTVVQWTNQDSAPHTATAKNETFDTGRLDQGKSAEVKFDQPGTVEYFCKVHPSMEGRIAVTAGP